MTDNLSQSLKNISKVILTPSQKDILRDAINLRVFSPSLSDHLILILGTQRSGTTLSLLMLQAHPNIQGFDETELYYSLPFPSSLELFWQKQRGNFICLKLPDHVANLDYISHHFPNTKIIWAVRNPYSVISSMSLLKNSQGSWIERLGQKELNKLIPLFPEISDIPLEQLDEISLGAYVWYYKNLAIDRFKASGLHVFDFKYEDLLEDPKTIMTQILEFAGLPWSDQVLEYHKYHQPQKGYPGNTKGDKPLDKSRKNSSKNLKDIDKEMIVKIAYPLMTRYGY